MKKRIFIFSIPVLILMLMTISPLLTLSKGTEIILETMPIDPRDIFRGEYITLSYDISQVEEKDLTQDLKNYLSPDSDYYKSVKIYSTLEKYENGYYKVKSVSLEKPKGDIYLKGVLNKYKQYEEPVDFDGKFDENYQEHYKYVYNIEYNIDKFFVPENSAKDFEKASEKGKLLAFVKVYKGNAMLQEIKIK